MFVHDVSMLGIMLLAIIYNVRESDVCTHVLQNACLRNVCTIFCI